PTPSAGPVTSPGASAAAETARRATMTTDPHAPRPGPIDRPTQDPELSADVLAGMRDIPDFPINGVVFKDFTPLLLEPALRDRIVADTVQRQQGRVDVVAGIEARGFILGAMIAH